MPATGAFGHPHSWFIEQEVADRIVAYKADGRLIEGFERRWKSVWDRVEIVWATWEQVTEELQDAALDRFYALCKEFNKKKAREESPLPPTA